MDLNKIQEALNMSLPEDSKRRMILNIISEDREALPALIHILNAERQAKDELISEMNLQLSRADVCIQEPKIGKNNFVIQEIDKFYRQYANYVRHCFPKNIQ